MPKTKRRKPYRPPAVPPQGDVGPDTPAQRAGTVVTIITEDNDAQWRRKRREHPLDVMLANGKITQRQCEAGLKLHKLYCITELSGDAPFTKVYVDTSPNPGAVAVMQTERIAAFVALLRHIPQDMKSVVWHVAIMARQLRAGFSRDSKDASMHKAQLQVALDILANFLRL